MKNILFLAFFTMCVLFAKAQNKYYSGSINHQNFRTEASFLQEIEQGKIDYERANACLFYATNEQRAKHNKPIAKYLDAMESAAWYHSKSMIEQDFFSHINPIDPKRKEVADRLKLVGLAGNDGLENIAGNFASGKTYLQLADKFIDQWLRSPGHKTNMLVDKEIYLGTGIYLHPIDFKCNATQVLTSGSLQVKPNEVVDHYSNISKAGKYEVKIADEHFIFDNGGSMRKIEMLGQTFWQEYDENKKPNSSFTELKRTGTHLFLQKKGDNSYARLALGAGFFQIADTENPEESGWGSLIGSRYSNGSTTGNNSNPNKLSPNSNGENNREQLESYTTENGTVYQKMATSNGEVWEELDPSGKVVFRFTEHQRDDNKVFILKEGSNLLLSIPLSGSGWIQLGYQDKPDAWANLYKLKEN